MDVESELKLLLNICRLCKSTDKKLKSLFVEKYEGIPLSEITMDFCSTITIAQKDNLSEKICQVCTNTLISAYNFRNMCVETQKELAERLDSLTFCKEETKEVDCQNFEVVTVSSMFDVVKNEYENDDTSNDGLTAPHSPNLEFYQSTETFSPPKTDGENIEENLSKTQSLETVIRCKECNEDFKTKNALKHHIKWEHGNQTRKTKTQKCPVCGKYVSQVKKHVRRVHDKGEDMHNAQEEEKVETPQASIDEEPSDIKHAECSDIPTQITAPHKKLVTCPICGYSHESGIIKHLDTHPEDLVKQILFPNGNRCRYCNEAFTTPYSLRQHIIVNHEKKSKYIRKDCPVCQKSCLNIKRHMKIHGINNYVKPVKNNLKRVKPQLKAGAAPSVCCICSSEFITTYALAYHLKREHGDEEIIYHCYYCSRTFKEKRRILRHMRNHRMYGPCPNCKNQLKKSMLSYHQKFECKGDKPDPSKCNIWCKICKIRILGRDEYEKHKNENHPQVNICPECGKQFEKRSFLINHIATQIFNFECLSCPKKFNSAIKLRRHAIVHDDTTNFTCDLCGMSTKHRAHLRVHMKKHMNNYAHSCEFCNKKFITRDRLDRHRTLHTGEKKYKCNLCDRSFRGQGDFHRHRRRHVGDKMYQCEKCKEYFKYHKDYTNHVNDHYVKEKQEKTG